MGHGAGPAGTGLGRQSVAHGNEEDNPAAPLGLCTHLPHAAPCGRSHPRFGAGENGGMVIDVTKSAKFDQLTLTALKHMKSVSN